MELYGNVPIFPGSQEVIGSIPICSTQKDSPSARADKMSSLVAGVGEISNLDLLRDTLDIVDFVLGFM